MDSERKTTRKNFLKWSGLCAVSMASLAGSCIFGRKAGSSEKKTNSPEPITAMRRIRPTRNAVARESV
jgi:hypothetical protein